MSTRKLLLILVPLAALLIFALLRGTGDGDSVAGPATVRVLGGGSDLPTPGSLPANVPGGSLAVLPLPVGEAGEEGGPDAGQAAPRDGTVSGRVVDGAGHAIAGETVFLTLDEDDWAPRANPQDDDADEPAPVVGSGVTDADGAFAFAARAGVRHVLHAGGARWPRVAFEDVHAGDRLLVTLPEGFVLTGTVVEAETHAPVANAQILALAEDNQVLGAAGADGSFSVGPLPAEDVVVGAWSSGFDITLKGEVAPALGPVTLELAPGRELHGRVVDRDDGEAVTAGGEIVLQLDVLACLAGADERLPGRRIVHEQTTTIAPNGTFLFESGPSYGFSLLTRAPGFAPDVHDRYEKRGVGSDDEIVITLRRLLPLQGTVVLAAGGTPVAGARVAATGRGVEFASTQSAGDGTFTLDPKDWDGLGPVHVEAKDAAGLSGRVRVQDAREGLLVQLVPPLRVTALVTAAGAPVAGADVAALSQGSEPTLARTGKDGTVVLEHPLAGPDVGAVRLQARSGDSESLAVIVDPEQPHDERIELALDGGATLDGLVLDRTGAPVPSALVRLRPEDRDATAGLARLVQLGYVAATADPGDRPVVPAVIGRTDPEGRFHLTAVVPDVAYSLNVSVGGFRDGNVTPVYAGPEPVTVMLDPVVRWEGRVVDAATGLPREQFIGQLLQEQQTGKGPAFRPTRQRVVRKSDAPGEFAVDLPEPGRFQLRIMAQDCVASVSAPADFDGINAPPFATLAIQPAAVLEVTIQDGRGLSVQGYSVALIPAAAAVGAAAPGGELRKLAVILRTDGNGLARFNLGEGGSWRIAAGPAVWLDELPVAVQPGAPASRLYRLPATGNLEITITDELGRPLPGVRVEVRSAKDEAAHAITRSAATRGVDGVVRIETLPPGTYDVTLRRRGYEIERRPGIEVHGNVIERLPVAMHPRPKDPAPVKGSLFGAPQTMGGGKDR